jgi:hypothetical protein
MKQTNVHFDHISLIFFLEWELFKTKVLEQIETLYVQ